jgi:hypothetical protein
MGIVGFVRTYGVCGPLQAPNSSGIARARGLTVIVPMSTKSREVIWGSRIRGAQIRADGARENAPGSSGRARAAAAEAWSIATADRPSRPRRSRNASTADTPGSRSSASAARRRQASRSSTSAGRATLQYGSSRRP